MKLKLDDIFLKPPAIGNCVYALVNQMGVIRYIGETGTSLSVRLDWHLFNAIIDNSSPKLERWFRQSAAKGEKISVVVLGNNFASDKERKAAEAGWIIYYIKGGLKLINRYTGKHDYIWPKQYDRTRVELRKKYVAEKKAEATK